jgi:MFS family permease
MPLLRYAALVSVGLAVACLGAALCPGAGFLVAAIFMLRHMGQGLASHTSITSTVKYFRFSRGKAVAIVSLGYPAGRAVLPVVAVALIAFVGWRETYAIAGFIALVLLLPAVFWLLRNNHQTSPPEPVRQSVTALKREPDEQNLTVSEVFRHPFFYAILPGVLAPSIIETALFFHQLSVASMKGWSAEWVTAGYAAFAIMTTLFSMVAGPIVDRAGATRLLPLILIPYVFGILILGFLDNAIWAWVYLALSGATSGLRQTIAPVMWTEFGGTRNIGAIRSMAATISVFASALGPPAMGWMMDAGIRLESMAIGTVVFLIAATGLTWIACRAQLQGRNAT